MKTRLLHAALAATWLAATGAHADDAPAFDRPGIAFSTATLAPGGIAWEQGLPDFSVDRYGGQRTTAWTADTLLRCGVATGVEVQVGADSYGGVDVRGGGIDTRARGGGDGHASVKWAPALPGERLALAVLGTASLPFGEAPVGGGGHDYELGVTGSWALPGNTSLSLYADRSWGDDGRGWLFSPGYSFPLGHDSGGYVEAGYGTGAAYTRVAGGGVTHMLNPRVQLDASFLRGLDGKSPDLQGGVGVAWYFN